MIDLELALLRIGQIEHHIVAKHPRAARDGELASMLSSLRDALSAEDEPVEDEPAEVWHIHEFAGQQLRHAHVGGGQSNHGYFQHPEDGMS